MEQCGEVGLGMLEREAHEPARKGRPGGPPGLSRATWLDGQFPELPERSPRGPEHSDISLGVWGEDMWGLLDKTEGRLPAWRPSTPPGGMSTELGCQMGPLGKMWSS